MNLIETIQWFDLDYFEMKLLMSCPVVYMMIVVVEIVFVVEYEEFLVVIPIHVVAILVDLKIVMVDYHRFSDYYFGYSMKFDQLVLVVVVYLSHVLVVVVCLMV